MHIGEEMNYFRFLLLIFMITLLPALVSMDAEAAGISLVINGKKIEGEPRPLVIEGRMLVPVRLLSEELGAEVTYNKAENSVVVKDGDTIITIPIGSREVQLNSTVITIDVPAQIIKSRTYIPLRFLVESLGAWVEWDKATETVNVYKGTCTISDIDIEMEKDGIGVYLTGDIPPRAQLATQNKDNLIFHLPYTKLANGDTSLSIDKGNMGTIVLRQITDEPAVAELSISSGEELYYHIIQQSNRNIMKILIPYQVTSIEKGFSGKREIFMIRSSGTMEYTSSINGREITLNVIGTMPTLRLSGAAVEVDSYTVSSVLTEYMPGQPDITQVKFELKDDSLARISVDREKGMLFMEFSAKMLEVHPVQTDYGTRLIFTTNIPGEHEFNISYENKRIYIDFPFMLWGSADKTIKVGAKSLAQLTMALDKEMPKGFSLQGDMPYYGGYRLISSDYPDQIIIDLLNSPVVGKKITLDAGHGGSDSGAVAYSGRYEKDYNYAIVKLLRDKLKNAGADVIMTREGDETVSLQERVDIANNAGSDIFVAVHHNSNPSSTPRGTESFYYPSYLESSVLAELVQKKLSTAIGSIDRGVKENELFVLHHTVMPATLTEILFISNPDDEAVAAKRGTDEKAAQAIYEAILEYFKQKSS